MLHRRTTLLELVEASGRIHAAADLDELSRSIADETRAVMGAHQCALILTEANGERAAVMAASLSDKYAAWRGFNQPLTGHGVHLHAYQSAVPLRLTQAKLEAHPEWRAFGAAGDRHPPLRGLLATPLIDRNGQRIGLLQLSDREEGEFSHEDEMLLLQLARVAALAIDNKRLLDEAKLAEAKLRRFFDHSIDLVCTVTGSGEFQDVSENSREILGYEPSELSGRQFIDFVHPDDRQASVEEVTGVRCGKPRRSFANRYVRKDAQLVYLHWSTMWSETDQLYYAVARDVTERVHLTEQLNQSQRLEAVGQLTGGVAHDFNNLLTVILGSAEALTDILPEGCEARELALLARDAGERGAELTNRLLAFARRQPLEPRPFNVAQLVAGIEPMIRRTLGEDIELSMLAGTDCVAVADPAQLESAVLNLCINARDAMPHGGSLTVEAKVLDVDEAEVRKTLDVSPGRYVLVAVTDTGEGMSTDTLAHAFEPFFTTKPVGQGTGLGLSMVYGFAKQSGGHVSLSSELGYGTTVRLYLPAASGEHAPVLASAAEAASRGSGHILVVEDDDLVRGHVSRQLRSLGYRVTAAEHGPAGLEILATDHSIDLLFTDVVMPRGMNGRQLADHARLLRPDLRVLYTSGYTEDAIVHSGRLDRGVRLLNKPYRKADLALRVREALEA